MSEILEGIKQLSEPVTKLVEVVSKGTGLLYEPTHIRRIAKAEADAQKTKALGDIEWQGLIQLES